MEKTKEQKQASKNRFFAQRDKAKDMLLAENLYEFINGLKYAYSLSMRYKSVNLRSLVDSVTFIEISNNVWEASTNMNRCFRSGILKPWKDTYWFDREKAESLQQYILEHTN